MGQNGSGSPGEADLEQFEKFVRLQAGRGEEMRSVLAFDQLDHLDYQLHPESKRRGRTASNQCQQNLHWLLGDKEG